jgi:hypothetical protein
MNTAAATPNNETSAGSSIDCDIATENGARRNSGSCTLLPSGRCQCTPPGGDEISALILEVKNAAMPALPSTAPSCRVAL